MNRIGSSVVDTPGGDGAYSTANSTLMEGWVCLRQLDRGICIRSVEEELKFLNAQGRLQGMEQVMCGSKHER